MDASGRSVARIRIALSKSERNRVTLVIPDTPPWQMRAPHEDQDVVRLLVGGEHGLSG